MLVIRFAIRFSRPRKATTSKDARRGVLTSAAVAVIFAVTAARLAGMDGNRTHPGRLNSAPQTVLKTAGLTSAHVHQSPVTRVKRWLPTSWRSLGSAAHGKRFESCSQLEKGP